MDRGVGGGEGHGFYSDMPGYELLSIPASSYIAFALKLKLTLVKGSRAITLGHPFSLVGSCHSSMREHIVNTHPQPLKRLEK